MMAFSYMELWSFEVIKLDACGSLVLSNPVTYAVKWCNLCKFVVTPAIKIHSSVSYEVSVHNIRGIATIEATEVDASVIILSSPG